MAKTVSLFKALAAAAAVVALIFLGRRVGGVVPAFAEQVAQMGAWGAVAYAGAYVLGAVLLIPGSVLTLAAGAIFGLIQGTALVLASATLGAAAAFLVARYVARGYVERHIGTGRLATVDRALGRNGFRLVFLLRLTPELFAGADSGALPGLSARLGRNAARHGVVRLLRQGDR